MIWPLCIVLSHSIGDLTIVHWPILYWRRSNDCICLCSVLGGDLTTVYCPVPFCWWSNDCVIIVLSCHGGYLTIVFVSVLSCRRSDDNVLLCSFLQSVFAVPGERAVRAGVWERHSLPLPHLHCSEAVLNYRQCFSKTSVRHCAYNATLFSNAVVSAHSEPNSKHWFTTSFLQPLLYLVVS